MRYIVYLLLAANVLYPGWNLFRGNPAAPSQPSVPAVVAGTPSLVMLHERAAHDVPGIDRQDGAEPEGTEDASAENEAGQDPGPESGTDLAQQEQPGSQTPPVCKALGPFDEFESAETVSDHLAGMGLNPMLHSVDNRFVDDYWVYVPGQGRQHARKVIRKLKSGNIKDYYVFDADDYLVSLGTFRKAALAEKKLANLQKLGVDAVLEKRYKTRVEHWLEMTVAGELNVQLEMIAVKTPGLQVNTDNCASLASR